MKRSRIDEKSALRAIIQNLPDNINQNDFISLDDQVQLGIDWTEAARSISLTRQKLYHWYYDTYRKNHQKQMSDTDKKTVFQEIERGYQMNKISSQFKRRLFEKFSQYDHKVLSATYSNSLRKCQRRSSKKDLLLTLRKMLSDQHE